MTVENISQWIFTKECCPRRIQLSHRGQRQLLLSSLLKKPVHNAIRHFSCLIKNMLLVFLTSQKNMKWYLLEMSTKPPGGWMVSTLDFVSWVQIWLEAELGHWLYSASLHRAFHYHPSIISLWFKKYWEGCKTPNHHQFIWELATYFSWRNKEKCFLSLSFDQVKQYLQASVDHEGPDQPVHPCI